MQNNDDDLAYLREIYPLIAQSQANRPVTGAPVAPSAPTIGQSSADRAAREQAMRDRIERGGGLDPGAKYDPMSKVVHGFRQRNMGGGVPASIKRALGAIF